MVDGLGAATGRVLVWHDRHVSIPVGDEAEGSPTLPAAGPPDDAPLPGRTRSVPRLRLRRRRDLDDDATARDWTDTGDEAGAQADGKPAGPVGPVLDTPDDDAVPDDAVPDETVPDEPATEESTAQTPDLRAAPQEEVPAAVAVPERFDEPEPALQVVRATGRPRRPPLVVQGLWPAALAGSLALAAGLGLLPLAAAVLGVQVFLVLGALALLDAPAAGGAFVVATATTVVADVLVLLDDGRVTGLAGAAGLGLVASLVHQISRKSRSRVTESLADTLVVVVVSLGAACLLALQQLPGGELVVLVCLAAAAAVLLAGRVGDQLTPRPVLAVGSTRGWPGLVLGLGAGVGAALLVADADGGLPLPSAALLGLVIASTVATADLAVDLGAAELRSGWRDARRVAALRPTALLLPYAVLGPVALLAGRLVLA